jgi:hypothetical protein
VGDLHEELREDGRKGKLKRVEGYVELRGLAAALKNLGISLMDFAVPKGLHLKPIKPGEVRVQEGGKWFIVNTEDGTAAPQIPEGLALENLPLLVSISDQGPNNLAALNFLQYSDSAILCCCLYDSFHHAWNDIKLAARRATSYPWRTILEMTLVYNVPYGPFGSGSWFHRKQDCLKDFLAQHSSSSNIFQEHLPLICREMGIQEPQNSAEQQDFFERLGRLRSFDTKGPLVKLMRWFSFFESAMFYRGELFATRMVLLSASGQFDDEVEKPGQPLNPEATASKDPKAALAELKKKQGTWKLAPKLITERNVDLQAMLLTVCRSTWKHHAARARDIKSPSQVLKFNVECAAEGKWMEELEDIVRHSCWEREGLQIQFKEEPGEDRSALLSDHANFMDELLSVRGASLATTALLPPMRYNGTLSPDPQVAAQAFVQVQREWNILMEIESAVAGGSVVSFLGALVWRKSPLARVMMFAYEQGLSQGCALQRHLAENLGDSRVVEVAHSKCKDVLRKARTNTVSLTSIQHQLVMSQALEERQVKSVQVTEADKVFANRATFTQPVVYKMNPRSVKLPLSLQKMMAKQGVNNSWPSPSPASLFPSLAATEWVFTFWGADLPPEALEKAWMTLLAGKPGTVVAQRSTGLLLKVVQSAEYGMLAWSLDVNARPDGSNVYMMRPFRSCLGWHHIWDLDDWVVVPTKPHLLHPGVGPIGWIRVADPIGLPQAICLEGVQITVKQMKHLLEALGVSYQKNMNRVALQKLLIQSCLAPGEEQEQALGKLGRDTVQHEHEAGSDLDEILSALEEDEANYQEVKKLRKQIKRKGKDVDKEVVKDKKPKGRGRGKGKGRGKGRGRGAGSKGGFATRTARTLDKKKQDLVQEPGSPLQKDQEGGASSSSKPDKDVPESTPKRKAHDSLPDEEHLPKKARETKTKSPEEILSLVSPPGVYIGISAVEHRFISRFDFESDRFKGQMRSRHKTASFAQKYSWQDALRFVHEHTWRKWHMVKDLLPLPTGAEEQKPGTIPQEVLDKLEPHIKKLPPLKSKA